MYVDPKKTSSPLDIQISPTSKKAFSSRTHGCLENSSGRKQVPIGRQAWGGFLADVFWLQIPPRAPTKTYKNRRLVPQGTIMAMEFASFLVGQKSTLTVEDDLGYFLKWGKMGKTHETETFLQEKVLLPFKNWFVSKTWFFTEPWLGWPIKNTHKDTHKPFIWWTCCIVSGKLATYLGELVVLQLPLLPSEPTSYQTPRRASYWKIRFCLLEMVPNNPQMIYKLEDQMVPLSVVLIPSYAFTSEKLAMSKLFQNVCWCFST